MKKISLKQREINWVIESLTMYNSKWDNTYWEQPKDERNIMQLDFGITEDWIEIQINNRTHLGNIIDFLRFMRNATSLNWMMKEEEKEIIFKIF